MLSSPQPPHLACSVFTTPPLISSTSLPPLTLACFVLPPPLITSSPPFFLHYNPYHLSHWTVITTTTTIHIIIATHVISYIGPHCLITNHHSPSLPPIPPLTWLGMHCLHHLKRYKCKNAESSAFLCCNKREVLGSIPRKDIIFFHLLLAHTWVLIKCVLQH
jgi:hypothetical protein